MRNLFRRRSYARMTAMGVVVAGLMSTSALANGGHDDDRHNHKDNDFRIETLSTRPDLVSGGDVLVRIEVPRSVSLNKTRVESNGKNVSGAFHADGRERTLTGLVTGLKLGRNVLEVSASGHGGPSERLTLTNHPISGPVFSGPQQQPFICETQNFVLPVIGTTLGAALDANCSVATRVDYVYKSTDGTFKPLPNPTVHPADLAQTTTNENRTVNYVVRIETGSINRAVYQLVILHDPNVDSTPSVWNRPEGWNERLIYSYGGGCRSGYHQGTFGDNFFPTGAVTLMNPVSDAWLSRGYAVATSTLNIFNNNCNDVISAETTMMVKERFIERYGQPRYTIGWGSSGGSMQQHLIAHNYPGLLDGITPSSSFSDALALTITASDCPLLDRAFKTSAQPWTFEQKTAVAGWGTWDYCATQVSADWGLMFKAGPSSKLVYSGCSGAVPLDLFYDPVKNPRGARCTYQDNAVNIFGRDPHTGFAPRPLDNVGVQYGLKAFNASRISAEQFLELNERAGGYDIDGNLIAGRTVAARDALRTAYSTGRINSGDGGLDIVPIIDFRTYRDDIADPHDSVRSRTTRARLIAANGHADNQIILVGSRVGTGAGSAQAVADEVLGLMDQWLANIDADRSTYHSAAEKVVRNKPREAVDACYTVTGEKLFDQAACQQLYPTQANARLAAGEPLTNDILKCHLKHAKRSDYAQPLTDAQFARLKSIFAEGVCDYSRPGIGQRAPKGSWLAYPRPGHSERVLED